MTTAAPGAEKKSNFFLGFLILPPAKRRALAAVYAYCRLIDDIVDEPGVDKAKARAELDFWRAEIERLYRGAPEHPIARDLLGPVADYGIPKDAFLEMIRGCAMDLEGTEYETIAELESYMRGVASSVGIMCVHIFGWRYTSADAIREFAVTFGYAFQLTNIIRDVGADLDIGRIYLPTSDIRAAGYSVDRLKHREHGHAFERLLLSEYARAKDYYAKARALVDPRDRRALLPAEIMAHVYEGLLDEIKRQEFRVLFRKTSLPGWRKILLALKAWWHCRGV